MLTPSQNDVVLGRGTPTNNREGNINFRNIVQCYKESYLAARKNNEKCLITLEVQQRIKNACPPGRFIRFCSKNSAWIEVDDEETRNKISQALRDNAPYKKKGYKNTKKTIANKRIHINGDCSDLNQSSSTMGNVTQNKVATNQSVPSRASGPIQVEDAFYSRTYDIKNETAYSIPTEQNAHNSEKQNMLSPNDPCENFRHSTERLAKLKAEEYARIFSENKAEIVRLEAMVAAETESLAKLKVEEEPRMNVEKKMEMEHSAKFKDEER